MAETTSPISARTASRAQRRQQLIEATIAVLARRGYAQTTLSEVAAEAGLSHGLVNFYFASKDGLLAETLQHLSSEYHDHWNGALAAAGPSVADRLAAVLNSVPSIALGPIFLVLLSRESTPAAVS